MKISRNKLRIHRKRRIRAKVSGTQEAPRLAIFKSLKSMTVQVFNDEKGISLLCINSAKIKAKNNVEGATKTGMEVAKKCLEKKIERVVFDRGGYKYHGKIRALAEGARKGGLKF